VGKGFARNHKQSREEQRCGGDAEFERELDVIIFGMEEGAFPGVGFVEVKDAQEATGAGAEKREFFDDDSGLRPDLRFEIEGVGGVVITETFDEFFAENKADDNNGNDCEGSGKPRAVAMEMGAIKKENSENSNNESGGASPRSAEKSEADAEDRGGRDEEDLRQGRFSFVAEEFASDPAGAKKGSDVNPIGEMIVVGEGAGRLPPRDLPETEDVFAGMSAEPNIGGAEKNQRGGETESKGARAVGTGGAVAGEDKCGGGKGEFPKALD